MIIEGMGDEKLRLGEMKMMMMMNRKKKRICGANKTRCVAVDALHLFA